MPYYAGQQRRDVGVPRRQELPPTDARQPPRGGKNLGNFKGPIDGRMARDSLIGAGKSA